MSQRLFVGNLPFSSTDDSLRQAFSACGEVVSASVVMDRDTGRSRGFGFVEMADDAGAQAAIDAWNGKPLDGRALTVNIAKPREDRPRFTRA
jgi:RNA recognition motif-containing protein